MKKPYFLHPSLPAKIGKYMEENEYVNVEHMTAYLIKTYNEFRSKNLKAFLPAVKKAYEWNLYLEKEEQIEVSDSEVSIEDEDGGGPDILEVPHEKSSVYFTVDHLYKSPTPLKSQRVQEINGSGKKSRKKDSPIFENPKKKQKKQDIPLNKELPDINKKKRKSLFSSGVPKITIEDMQVTPALRKISLKLGLCLLETRPDYLLLKENKLKKTVLLTGPQGSGKTLLIKALAVSTKASLLCISAAEFIEPNASRGGEGRVKDAFEEALSQSPCILHIENLEALSSKENGTSRGIERRVNGQIASCIKEISTVHQNKNILVIAESSRPQNIDWELRSSFKKEVFMPVLAKEERASVLKKLCQGMELNLDLDEVASRTTSYVAGDLELLVENAWEQAFDRVTKEFSDSSNQSLTSMFSKFLDAGEGKNVAIEMQDFLQAIQETTPTLKREGFPTIPETTWEDVGGLEDIKQELIEKIIEPIELASLHKKYFCQRPNGILLWGPPGCGKTMLAKCVANHIGINFLPISGPELLNMYQGETERAIRDVFRRAASVAPCVIFFDEFESICPSRTKAADGGSKLTIVNTLLVEMNGLTDRKDIYVIAATNRPDLLDAAVLRPGRIDTSLYVGLPDLKGRVAVFNAFTKNGTKPKLSPDLNLEKVSKLCEYFSGVDCTNLVYLASKEALRENKNEKDSDSPAEIFIRHFVSAFNVVKPSLSVEERNRYLRFKEKFENQRGSGKVVSFSDLAHDEEVSVEGNQLALNKEENQFME